MISSSSSDSGFIWLFMFDFGICSTFQTNLWKIMKWKIFVQWKIISMCFMHHATEMCNICLYNKLIKITQCSKLLDENYSNFWDYHRSYSARSDSSLILMKNCWNLLWKYWSTMFKQLIWGLYLVHHQSKVWLSF